MRRLMILGLLASCGDNAARPGEAGPAPDAAEGGYFHAPMRYAVKDSSAVAIGDVNGDGQPDVVVTTFDANGSVTVLSNVGGGQLGNPIVLAMGNMPNVVTSADLDGDGKADIVIGNVGGASATVVLGGASGVFSAPASYSLYGGWPMGIASGDLDGDGRPDLVFADNLGGDHVSVLLATSPGIFGPVAPQSAGPYPSDVAIADFDRDGHLDLAVADQGPVQGDSTAAVLLGQGGGVFAAPALYAVGNFAQSIAVADFDGDGNFDLAVGNYGDRSISLLQGLGDGTFAPQRRLTAGQVTSLVAADLDGDQRPELVVGQPGAAFIWHNAGDGTFPTLSLLGNCNCGRLAVADLNGDHLPDLIAVNVEIDGALTTPGDGIDVFIHR